MQALETEPQHPQSTRPNLAFADKEYMLLEPMENAVNRLFISASYSSARFVPFRLAALMMGRLPGGRGHHLQGSDSFVFKTEARVAVRMSLTPIGG